MVVWILNRMWIQHAARIARIRLGWCRKGIDRLPRPDILKLVPTNLDYTNRSGWTIEIVRALSLQKVAHDIGMDGGVYKTYE